jgi:DNA replication protein DnaD
MANFTPTQKVQIKQCLQEISNSLTRMDAERENIREIVNKCATEFEMNKRITRKLARIFQKRNIEEERAEQEEINSTYDAVTK